MFKYIHFYFHTLLHKAHVLFYTLSFALRIIYRGIVHDNSKLFSSEAYWYGKHLPLFKTVRYGSEEYNTVLNKFQHSIDHHYSLNPHHPEHHQNGYRGMGLVDLVEMYCDWKAASKKKVGTGDFHKSLEINKSRFNMSEDVVDIFKNSKF